MLNESVPDIHEQLNNIDDEFFALKAKTRMILQKLLDSHTGKVMPLESKRRLAEEVRMHLIRMQLRIECPKCKKPSFLRAVPHPNVESGVFQFDHVSTTHGPGTKFKTGSNVLPILKIIDAPQDTRLRGNKKQHKISGEFIHMYQI